MEQQFVNDRLSYSEQDEHPVSDAMRERVLSELKRIEQAYQVKVLYACESGSRGWGFASPDSDYDVRFIYVHQPEWYFQITPGRDVIERPLDDELDISGWELHKTLGLLKAGNPTLMEWLDSPIAYYIDKPFCQQLRKIALNYFSDVRARYHYLSMAKKNFRGYLQGDTVRLKKYLYVIRPLLATAWIEAGLGQPPMRFSQLLTIVKGNALLAEIEQLITIKRKSNESQYGQRLPLIHRFIQDELERRLNSEFEPDHAGKHSDSELNALFYNTVMNR